MCKQQIPIIRETLIFHLCIQYEPLQYSYSFKMGLTNVDKDNKI